MSLMMVQMRHPRATREHLGLIPYMLNPDDPRIAKEQFDASYAHGGWHPQPGFELKPNDDLQYLQYPDDPPLKPLAEIHWGRDERVLIYEYGYVAIIQPDGSFEVCRMD